MKRLSKLFDGGLRMLDQERLVRASGYFDAEWYARSYPEAGGPRAALGHFLRVGGRQGHDPGPVFSTGAYLAANPDVREAGHNALVHFIRYGRAEGRGASEPGSGASAPLGGAAMDRISEAFDGDFYAATNPDLDAETAGLDHFLGDGWRQRRDPCDWFSVEYYLAAHPDVADTDQNPFVHYLLWGCREGRSVRPSGRVAHPVGTTPAMGQRFAVLAMVRNEGDIIRAFAGHLLALFDDIVFVDHMSDDGTGDFLRGLAAENRRVSVLRLEEPAYVQSVTMTHVVRNTPVLCEADWVFLMDADEFLPFGARADFETAMACHARCPVIDMHWRNLVPESYWDGEVALSRRTRFLVPPEVSPFRKIAFQPKRLSLKRTVVAQGNHALIETLNGLEVPSFAAGFPLLHLPVRSVDQLVLKLNQGVEAYRQLGRTRDAAHGTHWDQMLRATAETDLTDDILNAVIVGYSEDKPELTPLPVETLLTAGHRVETFDIAGEMTGQPAPPSRRLGEMLMRIHGAPAPERDTEDCPAATRLEVEDGVLRRSGDNPGAEYGALEQTPPVKRAEADPHAFLSRLLAAGYRDIDDLVPSPKAGHIPFIFALTDLLRPRRFVEIGTLRGASFFAYCQAARQGGFPTEAVAVSGWAVGPDHAPDYRNVFETFTFLARKYGDFAGYLRQGPEASASRFDDGSIDLLHLDGFCDEQPLSRAVETWLPKLSDRGVLMLHDTNAHGGRFGVWHVWEDLSARYPTLDFPHGEGLGVACIGPSVAPDLRRLCDLMRDDRHLRLLIRRHFDHMGRLSSELFSRRYDMAQNDARARSDGAQAEELSWLRQEIESLRSDNDQLRGLLRDNIAHGLHG